MNDRAFIATRVRPEAQLGKSLEVSHYWEVSGKITDRFGIRVPERRVPRSKGLADSRANTSLAVTNVRSEEPLRRQPAACNEDFKHWPQTVTCWLCGLHVMPQYCVVAGCRLRRGIREGKGISFFQFPNDTTLKLRKLAQKWLEFCGKDQDVENFKYHRNKTVCEKHFTPECFIEVGTKSHSFGQGTRRKRLHTGAVPTVTSVNTAPRRGGRRKTRGRKRVETEVRCIMGHVAWGHWCVNWPISPPRGHTMQWQRHHYV